MNAYKYNPWDVLGANIGFDSSLTGIGADWYTLCQYIGAAGIVISIMLFGLQLALSKGNPNKVAKVKDGFVTKFVIAILISGLPLIVGTVYKLAISLGG